jgi:neurofibromin 1
MQDLLWKPIALLANSFVDLVTDELLKSAVDAGIGSDQAANAADTLVSVSSVAVRGRVIARLRKVRAA